MNRHDSEHLAGMLEQAGYIPATGQDLIDGSADIVLAGGQESMSQAPHAANLRNGTKMGDMAFSDTMTRAGLIDPSQGYHMGHTAEKLHTGCQTTREGAGKYPRPNPKTTTASPRASTRCGVRAARFARTRPSPGA